MIPLYSYSQDIIQPKTLLINEYQLRTIILDKTKLIFLEKLTKQDSLLIAELEYKIKNYKESENGYNLLLDIQKNRISKLRFQNKLIIVIGSTAIGFLSYKYLTK